MKRMRLAVQLCTMRPVVGTYKFYSNFSVRALIQILALPPATRRYTKLLHRTKSRQRGLCLLRAPTSMPKHLVVTRFSHLLAVSFVTI